VGHIRRERLTLGESTSSSATCWRRDDDVRSFQTSEACAIDDERLTAEADCRQLRAKLLAAISATPQSPCPARYL